MRQFADYGEALAVYEGQGEFRTGQYGPTACRFVAGQFSDGAVVVQCRFEVEDYALAFQRLYTGSTQLELRGHDESSREVRVTGDAMAVHSTQQSGSVEVIFILHARGRLEVGTLERNRRLQLMFQITNLEIFRANTEVKLSNYSVRIEKLPDHESRLRKLKAQAGVDVTCRIVMCVADSSALEEAKEVVHRLCRLLTLATGTLVSAINVEVTDVDNDLSCVEHWPRVVRRFTPDPLIDNRTPSEISRFLESTYERYHELETAFGLNSVVSSFVDVRASGFIETRGLALVAEVDSLANRFAQMTDSSNRIDEELFRDRFPALRIGLVTLLAEHFPDLPNKEIEAIAETAKGMYRRSFSSKLSAVCRHFRVPTNSRERTEFVLSRNELVHNARFRKALPSLEFRHMIHFFDKLLLSILNYNGWYINAVTFEREQFIQKELT